MGFDHLPRDGSSCHGPGGRPGRARHRRRRPGGDGQPELRTAPDGPVRRVRLGPSARADQLPPRCRRGPVHRRALRRTRAVHRSRARRGAGRHRVRTPVHHRSGHRCRGDALRCRPGRLGARRGRHRHDQLHVGHHRPPEGRAAHASEPLAQRVDLRMAHGRQRPGRVPAHPSAVPLQRLGHAVRRHRHGRTTRDPAQGRRDGDPPTHRTARGHADVRRARRVERRARRGGRMGVDDGT